MTDSTTPKRPHRALLVPANTRRPIREVPIDDLDPRTDIARNVGGFAEGTHFDLDVAVYRRQLSGLDLPKNPRATEYVLKQSRSAKRGELAHVDLSEWGIFGDALFVGQPKTRDGSFFLHDVPRKILDHFAQVVRRPHGMDR